jgi:hypothetical protein
MLRFLAPAVTGGLAGSILTIIVNSIRTRWLRPRLRIVFQNSEPGCLLDTNVVGTTQPVQRYVRLKIKNAGRSTARGVAVCITKLTFAAPGAGSRSFEEDVLDLLLANHQPSPFILAPGAHRYIDLAFVTKTPPSYSYVFRATPVRLAVQGFGTAPGEYGAEVFAYGDDAKPAHKFVRWSWDGQFPGLTIPQQKGR